MALNILYFLIGGAVATGVYRLASLFYRYRRTHRPAGASGATAPREPEHPARLVRTFFDDRGIETEQVEIRSINGINPPANGGVFNIPDREELRGTTCPTGPPGPQGPPGIPDREARHFEPIHPTGATGSAYSYSGGSGATGPISEAGSPISGATGPTAASPPPTFMTPALEIMTNRQAREMEDMARRQVREMEDMSRRHMDETQELLRTEQDRLQAEGNLHQTIRGFDMRGIRLPHGNKAAFSARELFAQQSDMRTHDQGLQVVLNALYSVVSTFAGCEAVPLRDYDFTMNFANAAASDSKRFSVRMKSPMSGNIEMVQRLSPGNFEPEWEVALNGQRIHIVQTTTQTRVRPARPAGREDRIISIE